MSDPIIKHILLRLLYGSQVPWRALQSRPVVLHLSDVWLCACPRTEAEWEEGKAGQRAQAAKQAELAALDLIRQSKPGGKSAAAGNEGSSLASSFLSHLGTMLLNRLQMTICNIHICFKVCIHMQYMCFTDTITRTLVQRLALFLHVDAAHVFQRDHGKSPEADGSASARPDYVEA